MYYFNIEFKENNYGMGFYVKNQGVKYFHDIDGMILESVDHLRDNFYNAFTKFVQENIEKLDKSFKFDICKFMSIDREKSIDEIEEQAKELAKTIDLSLSDYTEEIKEFFRDQENEIVNDVDSAMSSDHSKIFEFFNGLGITTGEVSDGQYRKYFLSTLGDANVNVIQDIYTGDNFYDVDVYAEDGSLVTMIFATYLKDDNDLNQFAKNRNYDEFALIDNEVSRKFDSSIPRVKKIVNSTITFEEIK